jgi:hypothetical protein
MLIDGKDLCGDERNLAPLSRSDFLGALFKASGALSLAPMNRLLLYSFREVDLAARYGYKDARSRLCRRLKALSSGATVIGIVPP